MPPAYEFEHAVDVNAPARAAWEFWTNVENWKIDPAVEWVSIDGEFREGATGETKQQGQPPARWRVLEARAPERSVIVVELPGATARFEMSFEPVSPETSRLRQRITLEGPQAKLLASGLGAMFDEGVRMGMRKLADAIAESRDK
jgi:hypothetical protein